MDLHLVASGKRLLKGHLKGYWRDKWWRIYGRKITNPAIPRSVRSVVFVCKGNICRSPFAEHLIRNMLSPYDIASCVSSAGLQAGNSEPSPDEAIQAAYCFGVDLSLHRSRQFEANGLKRQDMVVAMQAHQLLDLRKRYPDCSESFYLLPLFETAGMNDDTGYTNWNITDPYGQDTNTFKRCYEHIERCAKHMVYRLRNGL